MKLDREDRDLVAALRTLRPSPRADFSADLDARAAAGFPPGQRSDGSTTGGPVLRLRLSIGELAQRLRLVPPRRLIATAGASAIGAIAVATAVVATSENEPSSSAISAISEATRPTPSSAPGTPGGVRFSDTPPPRALGNTRASAGSAASSGEASVAQSGSGLLRSSGPYAARTARRDIERSAQLVLATDASEVRTAAGKVFATVHSYDGIVLNSSIRDGGENEAAATFDLLIPSGKLSDALAAFSQIGEVRSRHESTRDVTAPTIGLRERLRDAGAKVESLLGQLAEATTAAERAAAEAKLRAERRHVAALRSRLAALQRRANFSHVSLRIESGDVAGGGAGDGRWGVGDALEEAGHILGTAAGVTVIGLAIVGPLALIGLLAWLARRVWVRRARTRALG
jgi:hypothetical protein